MSWDKDAARNLFEGGYYLADKGPSCERCRTTSGTEISSTRLTTLALPDIVSKGCGDSLRPFRKSGVTRPVASALGIDRRDCF